VRRWVLALGVAIGLPLSVVAAPAAAGAAAPGVSATHALAPEDARQWLVRLHEATRKQSYLGTFVVGAGASMASARIAHVCEGTNLYERIDALDGAARSVYRHNDTVHTVWPQAKRVQVEQRDKLGAFPSLLQAGAAAGVAEFYELKPRGVERVAGYEADVLLLKPKDAWRFSYRLWSERQSGLLLRAEVLDEHGEVMEWSAFSEVKIGAREPMAHVTLAEHKLNGYDVQRGALVHTDLAREGWVLKEEVPGFKSVSCVRRAPMRKDAARAPAEPAKLPEMLQAIYSDGLTHVSIFIEPYDPVAHQRELLLTLGANRTLAQRRGDWWFTVMGDVPVATLRAFASAMERRP
jgi:sigma-E factor negative regulatory protein RseB